MAGTLSGVRVIDMTTVYSGPISASILGDQGADVVKVEKPGGDMQRGMYRVSRNGLDGQFAMINRNKRSIVIDLANDEGKAVLHRLIDGADVLIENFRPGVMDRLGLTEEFLQSLNPGLIYASINGVGSTGPYAERRIYDTVIQAISGVATLQEGAEENRPVLVNTLLCDKVTGMTAAQSITSALFARSQTGLGQRVQISMLDSALYFLWPDAMVNEHYIGDDVPSVPHGSNTDKIKKTADGYVATMPVQAGEWEGVLRALSLEEIVGATPEECRGDKDIRRLINEAYARFTTDEICKRLEDNQVPFARINSREEVINDPQVQAMGALVEFEHPIGGAMRQPRPPGQFGSTPADIFRCSPALGEHTDEVMKEVDYSPEEIADLREKGVIA